LTDTQLKRLVYRQLAVATQVHLNNENTGRYKVVYVYVSVCLLICHADCVKKA